MMIDQKELPPAPDVQSSDACNRPRVELDEWYRPNSFFVNRNFLRTRTQAENH